MSKTKLTNSDGRPGMIMESDRERANEQGLDANAVGSSSLFSSDEELFAFARCVSRLNQMG